MELIREESFSLNSQKFLVGCTDLDWLDRGRYIWLLCLQHQKGHLTEKIILLNIGKFTPELREKFKIDEDGLYYNERLEAVLRDRTLLLYKQRKNGSQKSAREVAKSQPNGEPKDKPKVSQLPSQINSQTISSTYIIEFKNIIPPPKELINLYCTYRKNGIDGEAFFDYYEARGWKYGTGKPLKDWQAGIRTWERKRKEEIKSSYNLTEMEDEKNRFKKR